MWYLQMFGFLMLGIFLGGTVMAMLAVGANADRADQSRHYQRARDTSDADPWDYQP